MSTSAANGPPAMAEPASERVGVPSANVLAEPVLDWAGDGGARQAPRGDGGARQLPRGDGGVIRLPRGDGGTRQRPSGRGGGGRGDPGVGHWGVKFPKSCSAPIDNARWCTFSLDQRCCLLSIFCSFRPPLRLD